MPYILRDKSAVNSLRADFLWQVLDEKADAKAVSVQRREVGERSWSVLDTQAVTELRGTLKSEDK